MDCDEYNEALNEAAHAVMEKLKRGYLLDEATAERLREEIMDALHASLEPLLKPECE